MEKIVEGFSELFRLLKVEDRAGVVSLFIAEDFELTSKYLFTNWLVSLQVFI